MSHLKRNIQKVAVIMLGSFFVSACSFVGGVFGVRSGYDEPKATKEVASSQGFIVKTYPPRLVVETTTSTQSGDENDAFQRLFDYISGANTSSEKVSMTVPVETESNYNKSSSEKIAMTVPVETSNNDSQMTMRFFMPSEYTLETAPQPTNPKVVVRELESEQVAVVEFSGTVGDEKFQSKANELREAIKQSNWKINGDAKLYRYDPPFTLPFLRKNEVLIPVIEKSAD